MFACAIAVSLADRPSVAIDCVGGLHDPRRLPCRHDVRIRRPGAQREPGQEPRAARGRRDALRAYLADCRVCAFGEAARSELAELSRVADDEEAYRAARGNLPALRAYVGSCSRCAFRQPALEEMAGGVSDGSWTSEIGIPTVDGLGPVGALDHTEDE